MFRALNMNILVTLLLDFIKIYKILELMHV